MRKIIVSPSLLACDKNRIVEEVKSIENIKDLWLHFDVMDGKFVPNTSFSAAILKTINDNSSIYLDVHLMIENPLDYINDYVSSGADLITIHYEAVDDVLNAIKTIKKTGVKVGLSIKPLTDVTNIFPYLPYLDLVLVMSVEPGFGGQSFLNSAVNKIELLRKKIDENNYQTLIEVDGGINDITGKLCKDAGVDVLVAGSYLFGHEDIFDRIEKLKK